MEQNNILDFMRWV